MSERVALFNDAVFSIIDHSDSRFDASPADEDVLPPCKDKPGTRIDFAENGVVLKGPLVRSLVRSAALRSLIRSLRSLRSLPRSLASLAPLTRSLTRGNA